MKISGASIMGRALIVCSVCLFFATAVKADVCFLPADLCYEGAANVVSRDCSGFNETSDKGEGWNCVACGDKYKCEERQCPAGYTTSSTCGSGLSATCDGGKSGNKTCCKCEASAQKCINERYTFVKTDNNTCQDECPYNSSYHKICTCPGYEPSKGDSCSVYETCDLGDSVHEEYYKITGSRRQCNNSAYVTADSPQYTSGENDCTLACTDSCDNKKYYTCTAKITCNPSEGKYSTKELCEASLQQFSWVDWLYQTVQNINLIRTSYAGVTTPNQDLERCHYCRDAPNYTECMRNCMGLAQPDNPVGPLCPVDQDRRCVLCTNGCVRGSGYASYPCCSKVTDEPITACIGMMMERDMSCVHCKTDDPSWRAPGCEGYPCCIETPCIDDCTVLEAPYCTRSGGTWVKTGLKSKCGNDCLECQQPQATESPCELKDGCWVVKNGGCDEASGLYASESTCTIMGWPCSKTGNCWRRTKAELTFVRKSTCNPVLIVRGTETTTTITPDTGNHVFVDAGINTLSYGLSTGIPSSFTVSGPSGSTVMTAKQTGTEGAIGSYTFVAGKSYQITPNCTDCGTIQNQVITYEFSIVRDANQNRKMVVTSGNCNSAPHTLGLAMTYDNFTNRDYVRAYGWNCDKEIPINVAEELGEHDTATLYIDFSGTIVNPDNQVSEIYNPNWQGHVLTYSGTGATGSWGRYYTRDGNYASYTENVTFIDAQNSRYKIDLPNKGCSPRVQLIFRTEDFPLENSTGCTGCDYCITGRCSGSGDKSITSNSSTYEACPISCGNSQKYRCREGYTPVYRGSNQYSCEDRRNCYSNFQAQCNAWSGTMRSSSSQITSTNCRLSLGWCNDTYYYCQKSGCSDSGSSGGQCLSWLPNRYTNIPISKTVCTDVCCSEGAQQPLSYSYMTGCSPIGSTYTCQYEYHNAQVSFKLCYRSVSGMLYETEAEGQSMESGRFCVPGWIRVPHYTRCFGWYMVGCAGG